MPPKFSCLTVVLFRRTQSKTLFIVCPTLERDKLSFSLLFGGHFGHQRLYVWRLLHQSMGISDPSRHRILPFCNMQHDSIYWTELHFVSISVLETVLLPSLDCSFVHTRSSTPSSLYQIFSCSLLLCPEFYAQSTPFIFFYKWCKIS